MDAASLTRPRFRASPPRDVVVVRNHNRVQIIRVADRSIRGRPTNAAPNLPLERAQPSASAGLIAGVNEPGCVAVETHREPIEMATMQPEGDFDAELFQGAGDQLIAVNRSSSWLRSTSFGAATVSDC